MMRALVLERHRVWKVPSRLLLLLTIVFLSRVLIALLLWMNGGPSRFFKPDTLSYVEPAQSLLHGSFSTAGLPQFFRTPGYPLLLVPAVASGHFVLVALIENLLLATVAAWVVWNVATALFPSSKAAWWAVLLYCFEPVGFLYSETLLSDTAFTAVLLLFFRMLLPFLNSPTYPRLALCAGVLGCATYIRPASLYLGFCLVPVFLVFPRGVSWRGRLSRAFVFTLVSQMFVVPWMWRNAVVADYPGFSSAGDWSLYFGSYAAVRARLEHRSFAEVQNALGANNDKIYFQVHPEQRTWSRGQVARAWGVEARRTISEHWLTYVSIHARGCLTVVFDPGASEMLKAVRLYPEEGGLLARLQDEGFVPTTLWLFQHYPITLFVLPLLAAQLLLYYALGALGLRYLPLAGRVILSTICMYLVLVSGMPGAVARYRTPFMPLVCVCAGAAIARWSERSAKMSTAVESE